jgi:hypothetical protein
MRGASFPEVLNGLLIDSVFGGPARTLLRADGVTGYHDIAPRMGMAYDIFGNRRTAIKVNLSARDARVRGAAVGYRKESEGDILAGKDPQCDCTI